MRGCLVSLFLAYIRNGEGFAGDGAESLLAFLLAGKLAAGSGKLGVAVDGGEYPVRFGNEVVDFLLAVYDEARVGVCTRPMLSTCRFCPYFNV